MLRAATERSEGGALVLLLAPSSGADDQGRECLPRGIEVIHPRGGVGMDLTAVCRRRPELVLLPNLAERNRAPTRHHRRHQDAAVLLESGIDVWSTLEVGQLESLARLVERITGSPVHDTVPDEVFDTADEVELIDLLPEGQRDCLGPSAVLGRAPDAAGPTASPLAACVALRELALRRAADRLEIRAARSGGGRLSRAGEPPVAERLLVCVGPSPSSLRVVLAAGRMARALAAPWVAVHVGPGAVPSAEEEQRVARHLQLAEALGAQTAVLPGGDLAREILAYARSHEITKIVVGKAKEPRWRSFWHRSLVARVIAASGDIDVYVIRATGDPGDPERHGTAPTESRWATYSLATLVMLIVAAVAGTFDLLGLAEANVVLAFLLGVTVVAFWFGRGPAIYASIGAVGLFNFLFTEPRLTFRVQDSEYVFTFAVMLVIGLLVSTLTARLRDLSLSARQREKRTEQLYQLSQELSATSGTLQIARAAEVRLGSLLGGEVSILVPDRTGSARLVGPSSSRLAGDPALLPAASWVFRHGRIAGPGTDIHPDAPAICLPLTSTGGMVGVLAAKVGDPGDLLLPDRRRLVETFAAQIALALQRDRLTSEVHHTIAEAENERLRSSVLSCVSHDFRTPLATITGASSSLLAAGERIDQAERLALLQSIYDEGDRLGRLVDNLLHMTRLESGRLEPRKEWNFVEDLVGSALGRLQRQLAEHELRTRIPGDLPLIRVDGVLLELVLTNLVDNAAKYSPCGSLIEIEASCDGRRVLIEVADRGPGLTAAEKERAFDKFYRGPQRVREGSRGAGLGLAIAAAIAKLHGGHLTVRDRAGGGARFVLDLPWEEQPPSIEDQSDLDSPWIRSA